MSNITFLFGNGFDMRMGLKSSYKDAEANYLRKAREEEPLKSFQKSLKENGEYWSNFERAIGLFTGNFKDNEQELFKHCLNDFILELKPYLTAEESKIKIDDCRTEIEKIFSKSISNFSRELTARYKNELTRIIKGTNAITYRFISFNYTHVLDNCLNVTFANEAVIGKHVSGNTQYSDRVATRVLHVHGELPGDIIMGVDNDGQIENKSWVKNRRFRQSVIKPRINERAGTLVDTEAIQVINNSCIICVFGMSLGETDLTWWRQIGVWLKEDINRRLIIFGHKDLSGATDSTIIQKNDFEDEFKDKFMDLAGYNDQQREQIEEKIFVIINSNLFDVNLVELTQKKKEANKIMEDARAKELATEYEKQKGLLELATSS